MDLPIPASTKSEWHCDLRTWNTKRNNVSFVIKGNIPEMFEKKNSKPVGYRKNIHKLETLIFRKYLRMFVTHRCSYHDFFKLKKNECFSIKKKVWKIALKRRTRKQMKEFAPNENKFLSTAYWKFRCYKIKLRFKKIVCEIHISMYSDDTIAVDGRCNFY